MEYGHRERVALRKLNVTDDRFKFFAWKCIGRTKDVLLTGCIVTRNISKGPRKGRPAYDKPHFEAVVTEAETDAERARYEAETGKCGECMGSGRVMKRWHHITGMEFKPCAVCDSTGRVKEAA